MTQELRDSWEDEALKVFISVYNAQFNRTKQAISGSVDHTVTTADADEIIQALAVLYQTEPNRVQPIVQRLFEDMADGVMTATIAEVPRSLGDVDTLTAAINSLTSQAARTFATTMSESSLRLTYSIIESWRQTEGSTMADLFRRMERTWKGQRPKAAAVTETTRLYADTRIRTFQAMGVEQFQPLTRNDDRVRSEHVQYAADGPYPLSRTDRIPPYGDVNCRCTIVAIVE